MTIGEAPSIVRARPAPSDRSRCRATRHGTASAAKNYRCSCPDARAARNRLDKHTRAGRPTDPFVSPVGTVRRIRALQALGYNLTQIGDELGLSMSATFSLTKQRRIRAHNAERVRLAYSRMISRPLPDGPYASRQRRNAAAAGWATPQQWEGVDLDDPAAVSDLDTARPARPGPLVWEDIEWLMETDPVTATDPLERKQLSAARDERIAARLSRSRGEPVTVEAIAQCRRRARQALSQSKLTDQAIIDIRARFLTEVRAGTLTRAELAAAHGITKPYLTTILSGRSRPHLGLPDLLDTGSRRNPKPRRKAVDTIGTTSPSPTKIRDAASPGDAAQRTEAA